MSKAKSKHRPTPATVGQAPDADYLIGKGRPPLHTRFRPGQSGNPKGRPKGRRNVKSELREIAARKILVRDGDRERRFSLAAANVLAHALKGAKGDARSSAVFFNRLDKLLSDEGIESAARSAQPAGVASKSLSDSLFQNLEPNLLSREEQIELSHLAEVIDLGGDITALSTIDFERIQYLINKGRAKDVTPQ